MGFLCVLRDATFAICLSCTHLACQIMIAVGACVRVCVRVCARARVCVCVYVCFIFLFLTCMSVHVCALGRLYIETMSYIVRTNTFLLYEWMCLT